MGFTLAIIALLWTYRELRSRKIITSVITGVILCCLYLEWTKVFYPFVDEPAISVLSPDRPTNLSGSLYAGIRWRSFFTEVHLRVFNRSRFDYSNLDFTISSDEPIAQVGQTRNSILCRVIPGAKGGADVTEAEIRQTDPVTGKSVITRPENNSDNQDVEDVDLIAPGPKRLQCDKIPSGSSTTVVLAFVNMNDQNMATPLRIPNSVMIDGSYEAAERTITLKATYPVKGEPH